MTRTIYRNSIGLTELRLEHRRLVESLEFPCQVGTLFMGERDSTIEGPLANSSEASRCPPIETLLTTPHRKCRVVTHAYSERSYCKCQRLEQVSKLFHGHITRKRKLLTAHYVFIIHENPSSARSRLHSWRRIVAVLAETLLKSPKKIFIFIIKKNVCWLKVSKNKIFKFWKKLHCWRRIVWILFIHETVTCSSVLPFQPNYRLGHPEN